MIETECLVIGGGPAGLTAAIYLGRFLRKVVVIDGGSSRARWIPTSHNYPGFENGISGNELLEHLRKQALDYGAHFVQGEVGALKILEDSRFEATYGTERIVAAKVILASGMIDKKPDLLNLKEFIYDGVIRFCPICDGFEAKDKRVGIIGGCESIFKKARFLRTYTSRIEILPLDPDITCGVEERRELKALGLIVPHEPVVDLKPNGDTIVAIMKSGRTIELDILYPAMGADVRTTLARNIGAQANDSGCLYTDTHQQTNVPGLYAAGDITLDLSQLSVATGQAAIAATHAHNSLPLNAR